MLSQYKNELAQTLSQYSDAESRSVAQAVNDANWKEFLKADFEFFSDEVLGFNNSPHQKEWCDTLGNEEYKKLVIAAPRNHSKTTVFSINYPLWEIAKNPNVRILLVSAAETQSASFLRQIKGVIERSREYVDFAGQLRPAIPERWTDREIILKRDRTDLKDPTISTVSVEGTILSKRADIIIVDDMLNFENTRTPEQRQKIKDWFNLVLMPVLEPNGKLVVVGTIWQVGDLMEELLADPVFDYRKRYKAIIHEPTREDLWQQWCDLYVEEREDNRARARAFMETHYAEMQEGVEVMWPDRLPYYDLYLKRYSDPYAFARAYQNDPASRPSQVIKREWITIALEKGRALKLQDAPHTEYINLTTIGLDLAISQETFSDDTCEDILDRLEFDWMGNKKGHYILRQIRRGKMTMDQTVAMITTDYYAVSPQGIRVESVAYQQAVEQSLTDSGVPVKGHRTGTEKWDSTIGVVNIANLLERGQLILPSDPHDARTKDLIGKLVAEMLAFPEGHTGDSLMALWFAWLEMYELTRGGYVLPESASKPKVIEEIVKTPETVAAQNKALDATAVHMSDANRRYWTPQMTAMATTTRQRARDAADAEAKRTFTGH